MPSSAGCATVDATVLPMLPGYIPSGQSGRPTASATSRGRWPSAFDSGISPSVAGFHMGAEAQTGVFHSPKGDMTLAIFDYPTNQMAMQKIAEFGKIPGAMAKRDGPLMAVILSPPDPDAAERLLAKVRYSAIITQDQYVPRPPRQHWQSGNKRFYSHRHTRCVLHRVRALCGRSSRVAAAWQERRRGRRHDRVAPQQALTSLHKVLVLFVLEAKR